MSSQSREDKLLETLERISAQQASDVIDFFEIFINDYEKEHGLTPFVVEAKLRIKKARELYV